MTLWEEEWLLGIDINLHIYIDTDFIYLRIWGVFIVEIQN